jgi:REP element-mobilizing transposase RayT
MPSSAATTANRLSLPRPITSAIGKGLTDAGARHSRRIHARVLMTNHVHLWACGAAAYGISEVMQALGRLHVGHVNRRHHRTATLWERQCNVSLIDAEACLLTASVTAS